MKTTSCPLHVKDQSYSVPEFVLSRRLRPLPERLRKLNVDSSVTDDKQALTIIAVIRSKEAFQKARKQHAERPLDLLKTIPMC